MNQPPVPEPIPGLADEDVLLTIADVGKTRKNHLGLLIRQYTRPDGSSYQTTEVPTSVLKALGTSKLEDFLRTWRGGEQKRSRAKTRKALILSLLKDDVCHSTQTIAFQCNCTTAYVRIVRKDAFPEKAIGRTARKIISYWKANPEASASEVATSCGSTSGYVRKMKIRHGLGKQEEIVNEETNEGSKERANEWTRDWKRTPLPSPSSSRSLTPSAD